MSTAVNDDRLLRSSAAVATGTLLSRLTGLVRVFVLAYAVGLGTLADGYNIANATPNIVYELVLGGVLTATLVPLFVEHIAHGDDRATSAIFTTTLTTLTVLTGIAMLCAPWIARLYALDTHGSDRTAQLHVMVLFTLCFLPQMVFYGLFALAAAVLNAHRRFVAAAYAPVLNNLIVIAMLLAFARITADERGRWTDAAHVRNQTDLLLLLGLGTTAGIVAMALALLPALRAAGVHLRPVFEWRHAAVRKMVRLSGSTFGYVVANQLALLFILVLAKTGDTGDVSAYLYAFAFYQVPHGLFAVSIMTTMTPELARRVSAGDTEGLTRDFNLGLRYLVIVVLPAAVAFIVLAQPLVGMLVHGSFTPHDAKVTADTLQAFTIGLLPFSVYLYTLRGFYARYDTRTPFLLNLLENGANVVLAVALYPTFGVQGLALAWSGAYVVGAIAALLALRRTVGGVPGRAARTTLIRASIGSLALAIVAAPLASAIGHSPAARAVLASAAGALAGGLVYLLVLFALRADELRSLVTMVRRRRTGSASNTGQVEGTGGPGTIDM